MYTSEKLIALGQLVYEYAKKRFSNANLDPMFSEFVMRDVHRRFLEDAYLSSIISRAEEGAKHVEKTHTGTIEDLKNQVGTIMNNVSSDKK